MINWNSIIFIRGGAINFGQWRRRVAVAYSSQFIDQLRTQYPALNTVSKTALAKMLRDAGARYLDEKHRTDMERALKPNTDAKSRHRRQLAKIAKSAAQLKLQLAQLEKAAADLMWLPIRDSITEIVSGNPTQFGNETGTHKDGQTVPAFLLNEKHLDQALSVIEALAGDAADQLPKEVGGRPDHPGLRQWVEAMRRVWTGPLEQKFTVTHSSDGVSRTVAFLSDAIYVLDPYIEERTLAAVMRDVRDNPRSERTETPKLTAGDSARVGP
jgi:hypothetical protein